MTLDSVLHEQEPNFDVHQLAHVELLTPRPDETLRFFKALLGMQETARAGQSVYLRAYEDWYHHTLKITESKKAGLGHMAWRTSSRAALKRRVGAIEASGRGRGWSEGDLGHGPAYTFGSPGGHNVELLWDVEYYQVPPELRSPLLNRPQRRPLHGVPVRRLDHINLMSPDVTTDKAFYMDDLGFRLREHIVAPDGGEMAAWLSVSPLAHELAIMGDQAAGAAGRLHHVCYWYGAPQHLSDLADVMREENIDIEAGPGKHGITQGMFMYVIEPGGNRIELFGDSGYLIQDPDWKPVTWSGESLERGIIWHGSSLPAEFFMYGTPLIEPSPTEKIEMLQAAGVADD
ncbi:catechol 2,3-dioxygenase [Deinococcus sp.]|uniref:catechol 2,3-dioxygenase n=1 Tax=Deinococcus sp. TaxID=47478 RepID=UPI003CC58AC6